MVLWREQGPAPHRCEALIRVFVLFDQRRWTGQPIPIESITESCTSYDVFDIRGRKVVILTQRTEHGAQNAVQALRLLVENEIFRLNVWNNPGNDLKRGVDSIGTIEKSMTDVGIWFNTPSDSIIDVLWTDNVGHVRKTNVAAESWYCHPLDRAVPSARVGD